jgi:hypothetical protein
MKHKLSLKPHLIYASYINEEAHRWRNNVCGTTCDNDAFYGFVLSYEPNNKTAKDLVNEYEHTYIMQYAYLYNEMTLHNKGCLRLFNDGEIRYMFNLPDKNGILFDGVNKINEYFTGVLKN